MTRQENERGSSFIRLQHALILSLLITLVGCASPSDELMNATYNNDEATVRALLEKKIDVNEPGADGVTPLMNAAYKDSVDIVRLLIAEGANVNAKDNDGVTPLMNATMNAAPKDALEIVRLLIAKGAHVNAKTNTGGTALINAVDQGRLEIVQALLESGADVNARASNGVTALIAAADTGHLDVAEALLAAGAHINAKSRNGVTALHNAALNGRTDIAEALLDKGANINSGANNGITPIMNAAIKGHAKMVKLLLARGADPNLKDNDGLTALNLATQNNRYEIASLLRAVREGRYRTATSQSAGTSIGTEPPGATPASTAVARGGGGSYRFRRSPSGTVTESYGVIAPGAQFSSDPGSPIGLKLVRMRLAQGDMMITDGHGKALTLHAGMTIDELERAAKAKKATLVRVSPDTVKVFASTLHFENGRLADIENPMSIPSTRTPTRVAATAREIPATEQQSAISIERDPVTGKTTTFLAGEITIPKDWDAHDINVDNNVFTASMAGSMSRGEAIPTRMSDTGSWSTVLVPMKTRIRCPQIALVAPPGSKRKHFLVLLPGILTMKTALSAGSSVESGGKHFHVRVTRSVRAGEKIPVVFIGDTSIFSVERRTEKVPQPWFSASLASERRRDAIAVWKADGCR